MSIAELLTTEYAALNDLDAFNALRARTITVDGMAQSGEVMAYIASIGKLELLEDIASDRTHPLRNAAKATLATLNTREGFNFTIPAVVNMLNAFVAAEIFDADEAADIRALGQYTRPEFEGLTAKDVITARNPEKIATNPILLGEVAIDSYRHQGAYLSFQLDANAPAATSLEVHIASSINGVDYTPPAFSGSKQVMSAGIYTINIQPAALGPKNKIQLISKEFLLTVTNIAVVTY